MYTIYKADYNPIPSHLDVNPLRDVFDQGNPHFQYTEPITSNEKFQRVVHASIDHLYYKNFLTNNKASFGSGHINKQHRYLEDKALVISLPQSKFGESILPGSVKLKMNWAFADYGSPTDTVITGQWDIVDDGYGNLWISGSDDTTGYWSNGFYAWSPFGGEIDAGFASCYLSMSKVLVGSFPHMAVTSTQDETYKYVDIGPINITSSFSEGLWPMDSIYKDISVKYITGSLLPYASPVDLLGAVMHFTTSQQSRVEVKPGSVSDYAQKYNFENGDFTCTFMLRPSAYPTHPSGAVLLTKEGSVDDIRVDEKGYIHSTTVNKKAPYRLILTSGSLGNNFIRFEKEGGAGVKFTLTNTDTAIVKDTLYMVGLVKSGSNYTVNVHYVGGYSSITDTNTLADKNCSNRSNIYIGNSFDCNQGFNGTIDNLKFYKGALSTIELEMSALTVGIGNLYVGNVFYNHGMIVLTGMFTRFADLVSVECRGTHTIWENEVSCTIGPGEFGMSSNPTLQEYDSETDQYVYRPFVTGSAFKPFITTIGLYDNLGRLLVVGKLNTPIQTPDNMDTTFIVRYDR